jgi:hypothetical protein
VKLVARHESSVRLSPVADEVGEGDAVDFQAAGDAGFGEAALEQAVDVVLTSGEFDAGAFASLGAAEDDAFGAAAGEGFLGALGDEVALDFSGEARAFLTLS